MILIDTHIWIWWASDPSRLERAHSDILHSAEASLALSVISCWEVAKLAEYGRLQLDRPVEQWIATALGLPNLELLPLTPEIAAGSTQLPGFVPSRPCRSDHRGHGTFSQNCASN